MAFSSVISSGEIAMSQGVFDNQTVELGGYILKNGNDFSCKRMERKGYTCFF